MARINLIKASNLLSNVRISRATFMPSVELSSIAALNSPIIKSPYPPIEEPNLALNQLVWQNISKWPHHTAIECAVSGKKYSYTQLYCKSRKFGASLKKLGFRYGESIGIFLPNTPDYPVACLGALEIGMVVNTINNQFTIYELTKQMKDTDSKCIVCDPSNVQMVQEAERLLKKQITIICTHSVDGSSPDSFANIVFFEDMIDDSVDTSDLTELNTSLTDTALISYSSGTTDLPKGVCLTHKSIGANLRQILCPNLNMFIQPHGAHQDVVPTCMPFFHSYGSIGALLTSFLNGAKVVTFPKFEPQSFLQVIATSENVFLMVVPPLLLFLANTPQVTSDILKNIRVVLTAAAPISCHDMDKFQSKRNVPITQAYGMTEASPLVTMSTAEDSKRNPSTVGKLIPNTKGKVVDPETGETLPPKSTGALCFHGPQLMKCYLNNPEATERTIDSDGWLHSGDIGYFDEDGYFYVTDRLKDMIKVSGFQVAPAEIEDVLRKHPDIMEAGVVGSESVKTGEAPVAFVQLKPGSQLQVQEIMSFVASRLSKYKHLTDVKFLSSMPKTASGKILRKQLKTLL